MANNLFISYDLRLPHPHYPAVEAAIKSFGPWAHVEESLWYVKTVQAASDVAKHVWAVMRPNDRLIVIDTTNNTAFWFNLDAQVISQLQSRWRE